MTFIEILPTINALLNATSVSLLLVGFVVIRRGNRRGHERIMIGALICSTLFLVAYLTRWSLTGTHRFPDAGAIKVVYLVILFSHMILATLVVPLVLRAAYLGLKRRFDAHKKVVRYAWPIWVYVSVTGVVVYVMLYHLAPRIEGG